MIRRPRRCANMSGAPTTSTRLVCQIDENSATGSPRLSGTPTTSRTPTNNVTGLMAAAGVVLKQYQYTPYGSVIAHDDLSTQQHIVNRIGHQGLFFERFYWHASESLLTDPALTAPRPAGDLRSLLQPQSLVQPGLRAVHAARYEWHATSRIVDTPRPRRKTRGIAFRC